MLTSVKKACETRSTLLSWSLYYTNNVMNYDIFCGVYNTVSTILSFLYIFFVTEYCYVVPAGLDHPPASASQVLDCRQVLGKHLASAFSLDWVVRETD